MMSWAPELLSGVTLHSSAAFASQITEPAVQAMLFQLTPEKSQASRDK